MADVASCRVRDCFAAVVDPRVDQGKRHHLLDIITIALLGVICGADSWTEVELFGRAKEVLLRRFLSLPSGIPSHDTFGRVFAALDPAQFEAGFARWVAAVVEQTAGRVIAVDGKTVRHSYDRSAGRAPLHLVSAWASANRLVLAQVAVDATSNEITALPWLLETLDLCDSIVTSDAMGCQTNIAELIVAQGGDYVLALKGNQGSLYEAVRDTFTLTAAEGFAGAPVARVTTVEKGHGRIETRQVTALPVAAWLPHLDPTGRWRSFRSIIQVTSRRALQGAVSEEQRYYISSLPAEATTLGRAIRTHWEIENSQHWVLDIAFREDESRVRQGNAAQNLAVLRRLALNLLRQDRTTKAGIKAKRLKAALDEAYLLRIIAG